MGANETSCTGYQNNFVVVVDGTSGSDGVEYIVFPDVFGIENNAL